MKDLRLAHLSDLHFAAPTYSFMQFLSKRWLGNMNLLLFRKRGYDTSHLWRLPEFVNALGVDAVCLTGDFATTSREEEFAEAASLIAKFTSPTLTLPGNHDCYTRRSERQKRFYTYFPCDSLRDRRVTKKPLAPGWWWIGIDCAHASSLIHSRGTFFHSIEAPLKRLIEEVPSEERIVVGNHFPLFGSRRPLHDLTHCVRLQEILKSYPQVKLYLHGHDHHPYIIEREGFPLVLNAGSCARIPDGAFYLVECGQSTCTVKRYLISPTDPWVIDEMKTFDLRR